MVEIVSIHKIDTRNLSTLSKTINCNDQTQTFNQYSTLAGYSAANLATHTHTHTHTINEARVVDCHGQDSANEAEVLEMVLVAEPRVRVDLEGVVVTGGVLKQTVVGVEHLVGEEEEPLPVRG